MRVNIYDLPKLAEFDDVPYLVYEDDIRGPIAITYYGSESGLLPEIIFEGEEISEQRFINLVQQRASDSLTYEKYKEVLTYYRQLQNNY